MNPRWTRFSRTSRRPSRRRPGDPDHRGFEWYYLRRLCESSGRTLRAHTGAIYSVAFSPDGRRIVSAGNYDGTFKIWDVGSGQLIRSAQSDRVVCVAFSPDGHVVAAGGDSDNTVRLWDATSGALVGSLPDTPAPSVRWRSVPAETESPPPLRTRRSSSGMP